MLGLAFFINNLTVCFMMQENMVISGVGEPGNLLSKLDKNRQKTDAFCAYIYLTLTYFLAIVAIYGIVTNSLDRLLIPKDSDGRRCGVDLPSHPYIYFPTPFL